MGLALNQLCAWRSLPYSKFGVIKAWESTETENALHFEPHVHVPFKFSHFPARPAAFVSVWLHMKFRWQFTYIKPCRQEIPHFAYCNFKTGIYNKLPTQFGHTTSIDLLVIKFPSKFSEIFNKAKPQIFCFWWFSIGKFVLVSTAKKKCKPVYCLTVLLHWPYSWHSYGLLLLYYMYMLSKIYTHVHAHTLYYSASMLNWQVKNVNNSAVLHAVVIHVGLTLINCAHEGACHT